VAREPPGDEPLLLLGRGSRHLEHVAVKLEPYRPAFVAREPALERPDDRLQRIPVADKRYDQAAERENLERPCSRGRLPCRDPLHAFDIQVEQLASEARPKVVDFLRVSVADAQIDSDGGPACPRFGGPAGALTKKYAVPAILAIRCPRKLRGRLCAASREPTPVATRGEGH
jgi:hypothetical protein